MITLLTGIIGSGKSLRAVADLAADIASWSTQGGVANTRPVFCHGIRGLALQHSPLPVYPAKGNPGDLVELDEMGRPPMGESLCVEWDKVPNGAMVIIDECQDIFPPRGSAAKVPASVAWLQRSRHHAVDVVLITQAPRLIDATVRTFIGKHQHVRRMLGGAMAIIYEWDGCNDSLSYKTAQKRAWRYPKAAFKWYKSAEEHTKHKFKVPMFVLVPIAAILAGVVLGPRLFMGASATLSGKGLAVTAAASAASSAAAASASVKNPVVAVSAVPPGMVGGVVPQVAASAAAAAASGGERASTGATGTAKRERSMGCIASASRCVCVDGEGFLVEREPDACKVQLSRFSDPVKRGLVVGNELASSGNTSSYRRGEGAENLAPPSRYIFPESSGLPAAATGQFPVR